MKSLLKKLNKRVVLVIDDDEEVRLLIKSLFQNDVDLLFIEAESVEDSKFCLGKLIPHLVICDLSLTDGDGFEILEFIDQKQMEVPFILFTAHSYVVAPINSPNLIDIITQKNFFQLKSKIRFLLQDLES